MSRLAAAQMAWDYMAPPEDGDMQVCENGCKMVFKRTGPIDPSGYWVSDLYTCKHCDNYETKNTRPKHERV